MRIPSPDIRALELKTFLISLLCHLVLAQFFFLAIRPQSDTFKPSFIFLGSILRGNDFENLTAKKTLTDQNLPAIKIKTNPDAFAATRGVSKPAATKNNFPKEKIFLKSTLIKTPDESTKKNEMQNLGIETSAPKRMPLKLNLK